MEFEIALARVARESVQHLSKRHTQDEQVARYMAASYLVDGLETDEVLCLIGGTAKDLVPSNKYVDMNVYKIIDQNARELLIRILAYGHRT